MRKAILLAAALVGVALLVMTYGQFSRQSQATDGPRLISILGVADVQGHPTFIHIRALVPAGQNDGDVAGALLAAQHARPATPHDLEEARFSNDGLVWNQFFNANSDFVTQFYNPIGQPAGIDGVAELMSAEATWTSVSTSRFAFFYGGTTGRCPSLVQECPGLQVFDAFNDVAFVSLSGPCNAVFGCTLGVTYFDNTNQEADTALNSKIAWNDGCVDVTGQIDAQTVILHEIGHTAGLGHSDVSGAVMEAIYQGFRCSLSQDDIDGITSLYPEPNVTPVPTATPTPGGTTFCPPGQHRKGLC